MLRSSQVLYNLPLWPEEHQFWYISDLRRTMTRRTGKLEWDVGNLRTIFCQILQISICRLGGLSVCLSKKCPKMSENDHDQKCDPQWPPWPQQWLLLIPYHVTYQKKGNDFNIRPFNVLDRLEVIWPHHDRKCDHWPQMTSMTTTMTFSYPMSCDISNER